MEDFEDYSAFVIALFVAAASGALAGIAGFVCLEFAFLRWLP
jgi:hypothetical protein